MRASIVACLSVAALVASAATVSSQEKKGSTDTPATGQSERPKDPKHIEQESLSHNADKPKPDAASKPSSGEFKPTPPEPKKKDMK